jgi:acetyltransferase-like isoleucine patch superfamily enzyme
LRHDHRPYALKRAYLRFEKFFAYHFLRPHLASLGRGCIFMRPWHVEVFGAPVSIGSYATIIATPDKKIRLSVWSTRPEAGAITIGDYALICPGVRIGSAAGIHIAANCMLANGVYITDSDWHGLYDRVSPGLARPVRIEKNVWIGDSAIVCKGVTIGENSVIGAGSVVVDPIAANVVAAGNPARVVKALDPAEKIIPRSEWLKNPRQLAREMDQWERARLAGNTYRGYLRYLLFPRHGD